MSFPPTPIPVPERVNLPLEMKIRTAPGSQIPPELKNLPSTNLLVSFSREPLQPSQPVRGMGTCSNCFAATRKIPEPPKNGTLLRLRSSPTLWWQKEDSHSRKKTLFFDSLRTHTQPAYTHTHTLVSFFLCGEIFRFFVCLKNAQFLMAIVLRTHTDTHFFLARTMGERIFYCFLRAVPR